MAFAIYGSSQLFCVVWQVVLLASFAVITYAYLRIEEPIEAGSFISYNVITYAYLRIEDTFLLPNNPPPHVITYAYLRIEDASDSLLISSSLCYNLRISAD